MTDEVTNRQFSREKNSEEVIDEIPEGAIPIPLSRNIPRDLPILYSNDFVIQHTANKEFLLYFFELWPPLLLGTPEENKATLEEMGTIEAKCLARLVVADHAIPKLIKALQDNWERYQEKVEERKGQAEEKEDL